MRPTVSESISCRKNVFKLKFSNKNTFVLHEMDTLMVVLMSKKLLIWFEQPSKVSWFQKQIVKPWVLPKNGQTNSFLLLCDVFLFVFWKKVNTLNRHFEINWPLMTINFVTFRTSYETEGLFSLVFLNVQSEIQPFCGLYGTHTNIIPQLSDILLLCMMIVVWAPSRGLSSKVYNSRVLTRVSIDNKTVKKWGI